MSDDETPQIYLITPQSFDLEAFAPRLATVLDAVPVACVRLALAEQDESALARAADTLRDIAHARDVPLVITQHAGLVERHGLDGVHLTDGSRSVRKVRKQLGADAIVGAYCGASRHDGMSAGEAGADYVAFGPVGATSLGTETQAEAEVFAWWSQMIELPVVAEGAVTADLVGTLAGITDFFAVGPEVWGSNDPVSALKVMFDQLQLSD